MTSSIGLPAPLRPNGGGWRFLRRRTIEGGMQEAWGSSSLGVLVLSAVDIVDQNPPGAGIVAPHYHVSATHRAGAAPRACTDEEMERVRAAFGMGGAEEDNHGRGIARHLWLLCGRDREPECPCKQDEDRTVDGPRVRHDASPAGGGS